MSKVKSEAMRKAMEQNMANANAARTVPIATPQSVAANSVASNHMSVIRLSVHQVKAYEGNPRTVDNEEALNIKESIRAAGLNQRLTITKRPHDEFHILSNGGRTRLTALQQLAHENPQKFEMQDFMLEPYVTEEKLLAAHMIENHVRSKNMVLWDTAVGFLKLKDLLNKELGRDASSSEFEQRLKDNGLNGTAREMRRYIFVCQNFSPLHEACRAQLNSRQVLDVLQPSQELLLALWVKHPEKNDIGFKDAYQQAVALYMPPEGKDIKFSAHDLQQHINQHFAQILGYELGQMEQMLAMVKSDANIQLTDLLSPAPQGDYLNEGTTTALPLPQESQTTQDAGGGQDDVTTTTQNPAPASNATNEKIAQQGLENLTNSLAGGRTGGSSLRVAQTSDLLPPRAAASTGAGEQDDAPQPITTDLPGLSEADVAQENFQQAVMTLAQEAGVYNCIRFTDNSLPYGFYLEVPNDGKQVGDQPDDIAVQAWWYLNCVSGVLSEIDANPECLPADSLLRQAYGIYATGDDSEQWQHIVEQQLGGAMQIDALSMLGVITGGYALRELALRVVDAMYVLNSYHLAAQAQGDHHE
jgi:ParB family protein of integrating conjugative element (PFGI_1 class)